MRVTLVASKLGAAQVTSAVLSSQRHPAYHTRSLVVCSMNTSGGATSTKLFLLFDVKQLARKIHGSWEQLAKQRSDTKELYDRNREVWQLVWA